MAKKSEEQEQPAVPTPTEPFDVTIESGQTASEDFGFPPADVEVLGADPGPHYKVRESLPGRSQIVQTETMEEGRTFRVRRINIASGEENEKQRAEAREAHEAKGVGTSLNP